MDLPWRDVDPRTHAFDLARVRPALEACVQAHAAHFRRPGPRRRGEIAVAFANAIVEEYGPWASGWNWSPTEPGGGGPTRGWCCERDSVFRDDDPSPLATVDRALGALADWRAFLEELDRTFAMLRIETAAAARAAEVERAAARLLAIVVDRTGCEDAWYGTFACVLGWYLEAAGFDGSSDLVARTIRGRFESWVAPAEATAREVFGELGAQIGERAADAEPRDALADWRIVRERPAKLVGQRHARVDADAHLDYIEILDRARDEDRADRMAAALLLSRDSAARGMALSFDQLAEWQRVVLGTPGPVPFRTTDAFAKEGRERYGFAPDLAAAFDRALADASDPALPVAIRAARVYLDVCFFHPFPDGNARAARLALDHVLTSAGLVLHAAEPVFSLSRGADDPAGLWSLAFVIERSLATR